MRLRKLFLLTTLVLGTLVGGITAVNLLRSKGTPIPKEKVAYGFSFSPQIFNSVGLNWQESYVRLLDEFNWQWVRISFYWNQMIDENGKLNLADLWFQINEAHKRGVKVVLVVGAKAPFHPEVYVPESLTQKFRFGGIITAQSETGQALLNVEKKLIPIIATSSAITYWQVENEPFAGPVNNWRVDKSLLEEELRLIRELDLEKRPVILTHPSPYPFDKDWQYLVDLLEAGDILAVNYFPKTRTPDIINLNLWGKNLRLAWPAWINIPVYIWGPFSPDFAKTARFVQKQGKSLWIMEMQAEPYLTNFAQVKGKIFVFQPKDIIKSDLQIRKYQIENIGLWGAHWWLLAEQQDDQRWLEAVGQVVGKRL